jgi:hypothetical protein
MYYSFLCSPDKGPLQQGKVKQKLDPLTVLLIKIIASTLVNTSFFPFLIFHFELKKIPNQDKIRIWLIGPSVDTRGVHQTECLVGMSAMIFAGHVMRSWNDSIWISKTIKAAIT